MDRRNFVPSAPVVTTQIYEYSVMRYGQGYAMLCERKSVIKSAQNSKNARHFQQHVAHEARRVIDR